MTTFSSGCGPPAAAPDLLPPFALRPGTIVSSPKLALARPPQAMNAMFNLLLRFCPRRNTGAPLIIPAARARPTNSRRVIGRERGLFVVFFMVKLATIARLVPGIVVVADRLGSF